MGNIITKLGFHIGIMMLLVVILWQVMGFSFYLMNQSNTLSFFVGLTIVIFSVLGFIVAGDKIFKSFINQIKQNQKQDEQSN